MSKTKKLPKIKFDRSYPAIFDGGQFVEGFNPVPNGPQYLILEMKKFTFEKYGTFDYFKGCIETTKDGKRIELPGC